MTNEPVLEARLRVRPTHDPTYQPVIADLIDGIVLLDPKGPSVRPVRPPRVRSGAVRATWLPSGLVLGLVALLIASMLLVIGVATQREPDLPDGLLPAGALQQFPGPEAASLAGERAMAWGRDDPPATGWPEGNHDVMLDTGVTSAGRSWFTETGRRRATDNVVRIGGVARILVASIVMRLVGEGRMRLDDPIDRYVPSWADGRHATVGELLRGTSGVPSFDEPMEALAAATVAADPGRAWSTDDALSLAFAPRSEGMPARPGDGGATSTDTEVVLLVRAIERVTGHPIEASFEPFLVRPMGGTYRLYPGGAPLPAFHGEHGEPSIPESVWDADGDGRFTSITDLPDDVLAVLGPALGMAATAPDLGLVIDGLHSNGGLDGFDRAFEDGGTGGHAMCPCVAGAPRAIGAFADTGLYTSMVVTIPDRRTTISVVVNRSIGRDRLEAYVQDLYDLMFSEPG